MIENEITEEDVILANRCFVMSLCSTYGKGVGWDERYAIGNLGLWYAMCTYDSAYHQFHEYAESVIADMLLNERRKNGHIRTVESNLSLDRSIDPSRTVTILNAFSRSKQNIEQDVMFSSFIQSLPPKHKKLAVCYIEKCTCEEIGDQCEMSMEEIEQTRKDLGDFWIDFNRHVA